MRRVGEFVDDYSVDTATVRTNYLVAPLKLMPWKSRPMSTGMFNLISGLGSVSSARTICLCGFTRELNLIWFDLMMIDDFGRG